MTIAYFDCFSGAGGDMIVAALLDAGAGADKLRDALASLNLSGYGLSIDTVDQQGFAATRFSVELTDRSRQPHRHLKHIVDILDRSALSDRVKRQAKLIFERLAKAEAKVHGTTVDEVHFHEVGAVDAIVDVSASLIALELLGIDRVVCSPIPTGSGTVSCDHGLMPVPAPATAELLKGVPIATCDEDRELTTPTAAAVLTTLATRFGPIPSMTLSAIGYGAGSREGRYRPNILRVLIGEAAEEGEIDEITVLETNLDDLSPEIVAHCMDRLLKAGALDAYTVPIQMKKSRSGVILTVLCSHDQAAAMEEIVFAETTTFGLRRRTETRAKLQRRYETVATPFGELRMKIGRRGGVTTVSPEFEPCRAAAEKHGVPLRDVIAAAKASWAAR